MSGPIHFIEFRTQDGVVLQRLDQISTILESEITLKGDRKRHAMHLLLGNNAKVEILGETRESLRERLAGAGCSVVFVPLPRKEAPREPVAPEPVGNAVIPPATSISTPPPVMVELGEMEEDGSL